MLKYPRVTSDIDLALDGKKGIALEVLAGALHAVHDVTKSHSEALVRIGNARVHASSTKQKMISRSFFEAELNML